jgi:hypothetical protein
MKTTSTHEMPPNWETFNESMLDIGLESIQGLPDDLIEWLRLGSRGSDLLCIGDEREEFIQGFAESPCLAVDLVYDPFVETVRGALRDSPFGRASEGWAFSAVTGERLS